MTSGETVRIWGPLTRELQNVFNKYKDDQDRLPIAKVRPACNQLDLYPSKSQVYEMVLCAVEYGSPCEPDHITYGEFCVLVSELQTYYSLDHVAPEPYSLIKRRTDTYAGRRKRRVFLGGSCNPTTWRANIAIPYFKEHGITFYNPQVQNWKPELMELEAQAKQMADVLFFVIDNETRAISSMIETSYLVASQRQVVIVMDDLDGQRCSVSGEDLTNSEMADLVRGRLILTDLVERNSVPIFPSIQEALKCTKILITKNIRVQDLTVKDGAQPVKHGHLKLGEALLQLREAFNSVDSNNVGSLSAKDVCLAYKCCTGEDLDASWLRQRGKNSDRYLFEEFCGIVSEYREQARGSVLRRIFSLVIQPVKWLMCQFSPSTRVSNVLETREGVRDVYLGGSCGNSHWREAVVEPVLRKNGLSYVTVNPCMNNWHQKVIPIHVSSREQCRLLFYAITKETRALSSMVEAGYYVGKGCRMVLCVEMLSSDKDVAGEKLSERCICDYNRGRSYLSDLANREGVPLFDNVSEALTCVVTMATELHAKKCS